jgi:DNA-binding response OmpR family regulator
MSNLNLKPFTLLYAEDDEEIREGYLKYFKTIFNTVYKASDGKEAYSLYKLRKPDILILDINMPHINGLEVIKKIREEDKGVKIIIMTAYADKDKLFQAIPLNLVNYLQKPVKKRELEDIILSVIKDLELARRNSSIVILSDSISWNRDANTLIDNQQKVHLTRNEVILLNTLLSKSKTHYSLDDILEEFWLQLHAKEMTHNSIRNIIKRLKLKLPKDCIQNYYGIGYKISPKK